MTFDLLSDAFSPKTAEFAKKMMEKMSLREKVKNEMNIATIFLISKIFLRLLQVEQISIFAKKYVKEHEVNIGKLFI